eukprot:Tbor_TRINITY_DN5345_c0_g4::TRINITY_DN5345_c0_g4_i1::g.4335::m.4335/K05546/GANAB; alpha 1,3-glucosidase
MSRRRIISTKTSKATGIITIVAFLYGFYSLTLLYNLPMEDMTSLHEPSRFSLLHYASASVHVMNLPPSNLAVYVDLYGNNGTMQVRVVPNINDYFYEVTDVIVERPLGKEEVEKTCTTEAVCTVSSPSRQQGVKMHFIATVEQLTISYSVDHVEVSHCTIPISEVSEGVAAATMNFPKAMRLYGIPQHAVDLTLKKDMNYRLYNLDVFHYKLDDPGGIYGSIPFLMAHGTETTTGMLMLNSADANTKITEISSDNQEEASLSTTGITAEWRAIVGTVNIIFFKGPTPRDVQRHHSVLTGQSYLPPLFSLGFHQCRWNYRSTEDSLDVNSGFDRYNIPYDVLWLDIEHTDGKKYFTWDAHYFPDPKVLIDKLVSSGRKLVTISDPHIKRESGYHVHDYATANGLYVKNSNNDGDYQGHCWSGTSSWIDFYNKKAREWYSTLFSYKSYISTPDVFTWIDMNEPSVFNAHEVTMDIEATHNTAEGVPVKHKYLHNMYGFYQTMAAFEGHIFRNKELVGEAGPINRPFILTRSFFSGSQRYAAMWTGDNMANWDHLKKSIPMLLTLSISNYPFVGADVGGFFFNKEAELMIRWMQAGAFYPFMRSHSHIETKRSEPWLFGDEATDLIRDAIGLRYTLLPHIYTAFFQTHTTGEPVMKPLFYVFPFDSHTLEEQNAFMFGDGLLVRPVVEEKADKVSVMLPVSDGSMWFDYFTGEQIKGIPVGTLAPVIQVAVSLSTIPVYTRSGSIIITKVTLRRSSLGMKFDPFTLTISLGDAQKAKGHLFLDDDATFEYQKGKYQYREFNFDKDTLSCSAASNPNGDISVEKLARPSPSYSVPNKIEKIQFWGIANIQDIIDVVVYDSDPVKYKSLFIEKDEDKNILVIRKPVLGVGDSWSVKLIYNTKKA